MNSVEVQRQAQREIDERLDGLRSSEEARQGMRRLIADLQALQELADQSSAERRHVISILLTVQTYLERSLERSDLDGRVALETVNNLCWDQRHMAAEDVPEELVDEFEQACAYPATLVQIWQQSSAAECSVQLAELITWWLVASAVSDAVHAEAGEVTERLRPWLQALAAPHRQQPILH